MGGLPPGAPVPVPALPPQLPYLPEQNAPAVLPGTFVPLFHKYLFIFYFLFFLTFFHRYLFYRHIGVMWTNPGGNDGGCVIWRFQAELK